MCIIHIALHRGGYIWYKQKWIVMVNIEPVPYNEIDCAIAYIINASSADQIVVKMVSS